MKNIIVLLVCLLLTGCVTYQRSCISGLVHKKKVEDAYWTKDFYIKEGEKNIYVQECAADKNF